MIKIFATSFAFVTLTSSLAFATTKGLSQIVTPDLQKPADFSISYQQQSAIIGNPEQFQLELGFTPWIEGAVFQGFDPSDTILGVETGLIQHEPYLLSLGIINYSTRFGNAQPFLEMGYYNKHDKWILGAIRANNEMELLLGWAYDFDLHWRLQFDYQSGAPNFSTVGFTYTLNDRFQFNPALYIGNDSTHALAGYIVFTYTVPLWNAPKNPNAPTSF